MPKKEITDDPKFQQTMTDLLQHLTDQGRLIEAGWITLRRVWLTPNTPELQVRDLRMAFMAGAQHLFSSINTIMDREQDEPTEADMKRMDLINAELTAFYRELKKKFG